MAMNLLAPGLVRFDRSLEGIVGVRDFMLVHRPGDTPIAGGPVRAGQASIGEAHKGAEHDHHQRQHDGDPGDAVVVGMRHGLTSEDE